MLLYTERPIGSTSLEAMGLTRFMSHDHEIRDRHPSTSCLPGRNGFQGSGLHTSTSTSALASSATVINAASVQVVTAKSAVNQYESNGGGSPGSPSSGDVPGSLSILQKATSGIRDQQLIFGDRLPEGD